MKTFTLKQELLLLVLLSLPSLYLMYKWDTIPNQVALHFGFDGKPDRWGGKEVIQILIPAASFFTYIIFLLVPFIDPRKRIQSMGNKYFSFRLLLSCILSIVLSLYVYSTYSKTISFINSLYPLLAGSLIVIGNFLQSIKPNYFIGIRTPWALHSDSNWIRTHRFGGRWYILSGILLLIMWHVFGAVIAQFYIILLLILLCVPMLFSFFIYKTQNK